ncbi:VOC family protein [Pedobacter sp. SYP-B3415]|uniref:VOC family protein n=1 Tax=Pedobacter sp. SYP-B3415 TaxID=2496641 RepID=UPI00101C9F7F|nr:VOC family protein [Pedobacter sp. SYP-B3415]
MTHHTSITPFLTVKDAKRALKFYTDGFGAKITDREETPDGFTTGKVIIDGAAFWVGDEQPEYGNEAPKTAGQSGVRLILIAGDPDALFDAAIRAGATEICPVTVEESWKIGKLADPFGHVWEIGKPL